MNCKLKHLLLLFIIFINCVFTYGQKAWPSITWNNAVNISTVLPPAAEELSGLYWNSQINQLFVVGDGGWVYLLQHNSTNNLFTLVGADFVIGGPEGITQVNNSANEFYTIDENNYEIRKYTYDNSFSTVVQSKSWNLLQAPSPMPNTVNIGPEGIAFVPDWYLQRVSFISSVSGQPYSSTKGMGGLLFIAHQNEGYVWVYDVNPDVNNDFAYVGKYKTNRSESCDLAFDPSTGMMHILHNIDKNYLEVTNLGTTFINGEYKFNTISEYFIPNPSGDINIEGFALSPKFPLDASRGVWLCRDVLIIAAETTDAIRWFSPYIADGQNINTSIPDLEYTSQISVYPNPANREITIDSQDKVSLIFDVTVFTSAGQMVERIQNTQFPCSINVHNYYPGIYLVEIKTNHNARVYQKFIKR